MLFVNFPPSLLFDRTRAASGRDCFFTGVISYRFSSRRTASSKRRIRPARRLFSVVVSPGVSSTVNVCHCYARCVSCLINITLNIIYVGPYQVLCMVSGLRHFDSMCKAICLSALWSHSTASLTHVNPITKSTNQSVS